MKTEILSITTGPVRHSNMELLRIVAMFLVLVTHADFWSLGSPNYEDIHSNFLSASTRIGIEAISIVCVNVFILISGWFNIRPSIKGFSNFIFQCIYINITLYIIAISTGLQTYQKSGIADIFLLSDHDWFIKSYIGLYILSPVLNAFCKSAEKKTQEIVILCFFTFQAIFGMTNTAVFIERGYSTFSFIGLYLLGHYAHTYLYNKYSNRTLIPISVLVLLINGIIYEFRIGLPINIGIYIMSYINPLVIAGSVGICISFAQFRMGCNKYINYIGKSAFAVFLVHFNSNLNTSLFKPITIYLYDNYNSAICLLILFAWLCAVFAISIVYDQPRLLLWRSILKIVQKKKV